MMLKTVVKHAVTFTGIFMCAMMLFGLNGHAYVDPSIMTYVIQAVAGIVIAGGAVFSVKWRKAKKKAMEKLNIDENAGKEVEADIEEVLGDAETQSGNH